MRAAPDDGVYADALQSSEQVRLSNFTDRPFLFRLFHALGRLSNNSRMGQYATQRRDCVHPSGFQSP